MKVFIYYGHYGTHCTIMRDTSLSTNQHEYSPIKYYQNGLEYVGYLNLDRCIRDKDIKILKRKKL